jgi:hypothetical protein
MASKHDQRTSTLWAAALMGFIANGAASAAEAPASTPPAPGDTPPAAASTDAELRNTVINILEALVQKGVLTREQAQQIVSNAQGKAAAEGRARAERAAGTAETEKDAVRVTYVPQIIKDQIAEQAAALTRKEVAAQVVQQARAERWGVPAALPSWARDLRFYGDVRFRVEDAIYSSGNVTNGYLNFAAVNAAGGISKAGAGALLNTTENRPREVGRLRFGAQIKLGDSLAADFRLASGNLSNAVSTNQTLGSYGARWQLGVDRAAILWNPHARTWRQDLDLRLGRFENPFTTSSEMIFDQDLSFEGVSATFDWNRVRGWDERTSRWLYATVGAFPIQEVELSTHDKWLYGAQIGSEIPFSYDSKLRISAALYDFHNITGVRNSPDSKLLDFTAPASIAKGNTYFDIRNDADTTTNLFALAGKYRLFTGLIQADVLAYGENHVVLSGEYIKNIGWTQADVLARTGASVQPRTKGYEIGISVGRPRVSAFGQWKAGINYRRLERDAVVDSFTDSDFHLGGTDAAGYIFTFDFGLGRSAFTRLRYLSANQIDGPPLGIDVVQFDLGGQF